MPQFDQLKFLERATVHGNSYGTSFAAVDEIRWVFSFLLCLYFSISRQKKVPILDVDVEGAQNLKNTPGFQVIFSIPTNLLSDPVQN